jgi:signal transduction histidine kinase
MHSLHASLRRVLLIAGTALLCLLGMAVFWRVRYVIGQQFDADLRARSEALVALLHWGKDGRVVLDYKGEYMPEYETRAGGYFFQIWRGDADSVLERAHALQGENLPQQFAQRPFFLTATLGSHLPIRCFVIDVQSPHSSHKPAPDVEASVRVVVAGSTLSVQAQMRRIAWEIVLGAAATLGLLMLLVQRSLSRGLAPLLAVSAQAAELPKASIDFRFPVASLPIELQPIAERMNVLLVRLSDSLARERRFSSDVAHELRTPISELLSLTQVLMLHPGEVPMNAARTDAHRQDVAQLRAQSEQRFLHDVSEIAEQMKLTVSMLLEIAQSENAGLHALTTTNLAECIHPIWQQFAVKAWAKNLVFQWTVLRDIEVPLEATLFARMLSLLLDNAISHTSPGGSVRLRQAEPLPNQNMQLHLYNGPTELSRTDLMHFGERFWRKDKSRSDSQHAGLGLGLALQIAKCLSISVSFELDDGDLQVVLTFAKSKQ